MRKKKRVSPMKGRKISEEDRGPNAPKLGRPYKFSGPSEKHVVTLSLPEGVMDTLLDKYETDSKAKALTKLILNKINGTK